MQKPLPQKKQLYLSHVRHLSGSLWNLSNTQIFARGFAWIWMGIHLSTIATQSGETGAIPSSSIDQVDPLSEFVRIEPSIFQQGSTRAEAGRNSDETPHQVKITRPYLIGRTEVTNGQMLAVLNAAIEQEDIVIRAGGSVSMTIKGSPDRTLINLLNSDIALEKRNLVVDSTLEDNPCTGVTWYGALVYSNLRSLNAGLSPAINLADLSCNFTNNGFRLPTESEWEHACRAGSTGRFGTQESARTIDHQHDKESVNSYADTFAWFGGNSAGKNKQSHPVASKLPNIWGLYDMHGNVSEWCWDWYGEYKTRVNADPSGPETGWRRIVRGGDYIREANRIRSAKRGTGLPANELQTRGFRIARTLPSPQQDESTKN